MNNKHYDLNWKDRQYKQVPNNNMFNVKKEKIEYITMPIIKLKSK